ncbi:MAB_1171c family putative transporter [Kitasatospora sp. NPDC001660]
MIAAVECLAGAIALLGAGHRAWYWRGGRLRPGRWALVAFAACIGLSLVLLGIGELSASAAADGSPIGRALPLVTAELKLAACCFLVLMAHALGPPELRPARVRWQVAGAGLVMSATAVLYRAAGVTPVGGVITVPPGGRAALAVSSLVFTVYSAWCVGLFTAVVHRAARGLGPGLLRTGLRLVVGGGVFGLVWAGSSVEPLISGLRTGRQDAGEDAFSAPVALLALALGLGGASLSAWEQRAVAPLRRLRARRSYRRIGPLWSALHAIRPEITLERQSAGIGRRGNTEFALYRRVIEIRDAQLWLRAHLHPRVPEWAAAACGSEAGERRRAATVEAAVLAAALEAAAVGHRYPCALTEGYVPPSLLSDLEAETAWLVMVCEEFTDSRVVAEVRQRVRAELGLPTGASAGPPAGGG